MSIANDKKTYHKQGDSYWYTFVNGWGNVQVVTCTADEYYGVPGITAILRGDDARHVGKLGVGR